MKFHFLLSFTIIISSFSFFGQTNSGIISQRNFFVGFNSGITNGSAYNIVTGDLYIGKFNQILKHKVESNIGFIFRSSTDNYEALCSVAYKSNGLFAEGNFYFTKRFYAGLRIALLKNKVYDASHDEIEILTHNLYNTNFISSLGNVQLGYVQPIGKRFNLKFQGQIGTHFYKNNVGWSYIISDFGQTANVLRYWGSLSIGLRYTIIN